MYLPFEYVYSKVEEFEDGAFCYSSDKGEIDTPYHAHSKGQFIFAQNGTLHIDFESSRYFLPVGYFIWIPKNVKHRMWSNNTSIDLFTIYFSTKNQQHDFFAKPGVYMVGSLLKEMINYARNWNGFIDKKNALQYSFMQCFNTLLPDLSRTSEMPLLGFVTPKNERLSAVIDYMKNHLSEKLTLEMVAIKAGFSIRSLSRLFQLEGTNYIECLQALRVVRAMELLAENNMNINEAGLEVGYDSNTAFSNIFMRFTGIRPMEYVKLKRAL